MAGVQVDKVGLRIKADASPLQFQGDLMQSAGIEGGQPDINGLAQHVQAVAGDAIVAVLEHGVGLRRPVSGNDFKKIPGAGGLTEVVKEVEQGGINGMDISGSEILEKIVDPVQGLGEVTTVAKIDQGEFLEGMGVIKRERPFFHACQ